jgi:cell wall-associated NlpC family hydrolase
MRTRVDRTHPNASVRTSLRTGRAGRAASAGLSGVALFVTGALVWALASAVPSSATSASMHVASADRLAGSNVGLHPRVTALDAAALTVRTAALVEAQQVTQVASMRAEILRVARNKIGTPYRAGAAGPNAFDCGGFTQFVYRRALGMEIGRSSVNQFQRVERIAKKDARPGDLVFFFEKGARHVGIYIGDGKMIDAPRTGESVKVNPISSSWWGRSFTGIGRILPA